MGEIISMHKGAPVPGQLDEQLIAALKKLLAQAESGMLVSIYATGFTRDNTRWQCLWGPEDPYSVAGAVEYLRQRVLVFEDGSEEEAMK